MRLRSYRFTSGNFSKDDIAKIRDLVFIAQDIDELSKSLASFTKTINYGFVGAALSSMLLDTSTVILVYDPTVPTLSANVKVSASPGNAIIINPDGLYVLEYTAENAQDDVGGIFTNYFRYDDATPLIDMAGKSKAAINMYNFQNFR